MGPCLPVVVVLDDEVLRLGGSQSTTISTTVINTGPPIFPGPPGVAPEAGAWPGDLKKKNRHVEKRPGPGDSRRAAPGPENDAGEMGLPSFVAMPSESDGRLVAVYVVVYVVVELLQYLITKLVRCVCLLLQDLL